MRGGGLAGQTAVGCGGWRGAVRRPRRRRAAAGHARGGAGPRGRRILRRDVRRQRRVHGHRARQPGVHRAGHGEGAGPDGRSAEAPGGCVLLCGLGGRRGRCAPRMDNHVAACGGPVWSRWGRRWGGRSRGASWWGRACSSAGSGVPPAPSGRGRSWPPLRRSARGEPSMQRRPTCGGGVTPPAVRGSLSARRPQPGAPGLGRSGSAIPLFADLSTRAGQAQQGAWRIGGDGEWAVC